MATRFYLPSTGAAEVTPSNAGWNKTSGAASALKAVRTRISSAMATVTNTKDSTALHSTLIRQYVTEPLAAQTISGNVSGFIRCIESNANFSACISISIRACSNDGTTIRSPALLAITNSDLYTGAQEIATVLNSRAFADVNENTSIALTSCTLSDGDRLVIEIGFVANDTSTTRTAGISCGDNSATDLSTVAEATANNPWVEFSQTLNFNLTIALQSTSPDIKATGAVGAVEASASEALSGPQAASGAVGSLTPEQSMTLTGVQGGSSTSSTEWATDQSVGSLRNNFDGYVGISFNTGTSPPTITHLGRWKISGNSQTHNLYLVKYVNGTSDVQVATVALDLSTGAAGGYVYAQLATPVTLLANTRYYIYSSEANGLDYFYNEDGTTLTAFTPDVVTIDVAGWSSTTATTFNAQNVTPHCYGPVNFKSGLGNVGNVTVLESPDRTVALTGIQATSEIGSAECNLSLALSGIAASGAIDSVGVGAGLSGIEAAGAIGDLAKANTDGLTGNPATGVLGDVIPNNSPPALGGVSASGAVGSLALREVSIGLTGCAATGLPGSFSPAIATASTGISATGEVGSVTSEISAAVFGIAATAAAGSVSISQTIPLAGAQATSEVIGSILPNSAPALTGVSATAVASGGGSVAVSDNFNRSNGGLGGNWTTVTGHDPPQIFGNQVNNIAGQGGGSAPWHSPAAYWSASIFGNDQYAEAICNQPLEQGSGGVYVGPAVRVSNSADTWYGLEFDTWDDSGEGGPYLLNVRIVKSVAGTRTGITSWYGPLDNIGRVYRLEVSGISLTAKYATTHGGTYTTILTTDDASIASGSAGILCFIIYLGVPYPGGVADNWYGGDLGGGGGGGLTPSTSVAATGLQTTAACGTSSVQARPVSGLIGLVASGYVDNLTKSIAAALSGSEAIATAGDLSPSIQASAFGIEATAVVGNVGVIAQDVTLQLTGVAATGMMGSVGADVVVSLTGTQAAGAVESVTPLASIPLAGQSASTAVEALSISQSHALIGNLTTGLVSVAGGTAANDNFNRTAGPLGANWGNLWHASGAQDIQIASNAANGVNAKATASWVANAFADDQYAEIKVTNEAAGLIDNSSLIGGVGPAVRLQANGQGGYYACTYSWDDGEGSTGCEVILGRLVSGTAFQIARYSTTSGWSQGKVFRLEVSGIDLTLKWASSHGGSYTTLLTGSDNNFASGNAGLACATGSWADDWYAGDLAAGGGGLAPLISLALVGQSATAATGTVTAGITRALTGNVATASVGTVNPGNDVTIPLSGVSATAEVGSVSPSLEAAITGTQAAGQVGELGLEQGITGVAATAEAGTFSADLSIELTGVQAASSTGIVLTGNDVTATLTGIESVAAAGDLALAIDSTIAGMAMTGEVGTIEVLANDVMIELTGIEAACAVGSVMVGTVIQTTGIAAAGSIGTFGPTDLQTYEINAAHGADDVCILDWNSTYQYIANDPSYQTTIKSHNPAAPELVFSAVGALNEGQELRDASTSRGGLLFRNISVSGSVASATLRIYLLDWDTSDYRDPFTDLPGYNPYWLHVHGAKRARPAPGFDLCPFPSLPNWGVPTAWPIHEGSSAGPEDASFNSGENQNWYPSMWDQFTQHEFNQRTDARTLVPVPRGPAGYIDIDVTAIVKELTTWDYTVPDWQAGYIYQPGGIAFVISGQDWFTHLPLMDTPAGMNGYNGYPISPHMVMAGGNLYYCFKAPLNNSYVSTNPPTGTGDSYPDGANGAGWRYIKAGNARSWQSGDNIAFVLLTRPPFGEATFVYPYGFPFCPVEGYRIFASGDNADPNKYPQLLIHSGATADVTIALTGISATGQVGSPSADSSMSVTGSQVNAVVGSVTTEPVSIALSGIAATASIGSIVQTIDSAIAGIIATAEVGSVVGGQPLIGLQAAGVTGSIASADISIELGGVATTADAGTVSTSSDRTAALTGIDATGQIQTPAPNVTRVLTGIVATGAAGNVAIALGINGIAATAAIGSVSPGATAAALVGLATSTALSAPTSATACTIAGLGAAGTAGTLIASIEQGAEISGIGVTGPVDAPIASVAIALSGVVASGSAGSMLAALAKPALGIAAAGSVGDVVPGLQLAGQQGIGQVGSVADEITVSLSGVAIVGAVGTLQAKQGYTEPATGIEALGQVGSVSGLSIDVRLVGIVAAGIAGTPTAALEVVIPDGVVASGDVGNITFVEILFDPDNRNVWIERTRGNDWIEKARNTAWQEKARGRVWRASAGTSWRS